MDRRLMIKARVLMWCEAGGFKGVKAGLIDKKLEFPAILAPPPYQDWGRAGTAVNRFARDDKELRPQLRETITRKTAS
jgi:hypothetical protein